MLLFRYIMNTKKMTGGYMKILIIADVHQRFKVNAFRRKRTLRGLRNAFGNLDFDLSVFLGDLIHGPDYRDNKSRYVSDLKEVLDTTGNKPFAFVFGNHDDECAMTKDEILEVINGYKNSVTKGKDYVLNMNNETLLFIDSGSYYDGEGSFYDTVKEDTILRVREQIEGKKAIAFQHIIVPDIFDVIEKCGKKTFPLKKNRQRFKQGFEFTGNLREKPCPPDINTGELKTLAPFLKGMVFGHDHINDFECFIDGVKIIQCPASGMNCYEYPRFPKAKILDTETMETQLIKL